MGFVDFLAILGCNTRYQERIAPKSIEIDIEKLHTKFSKVQVSTFNRFNKTCSRGHQRAVPQ